jgi:Glu-tRNA(Gln) amidotransferase subunit E-like FAD-binding protein
MSNPLQI